MKNIFLEQPSAEWKHRRHNHRVHLWRKREHAERGEQDVYLQCKRSADRLYGRDDYGKLCVQSERTALCEDSRRRNEVFCIQWDEYCIMTHTLERQCGLWGYFTFVHWVEIVGKEELSNQNIQNEGCVYRQPSFCICEYKCCFLLRKDRVCLAVLVWIGSEIMEISQIACFKPRLQKSVLNIVLKNRIARRFQIYETCRRFPIGLHDYRVCTKVHAERAESVNFFHICIIVGRF